jgi:phosphoglycerate kinase
LPESLRGKRVLVRVGFDVPIENGVVSDDVRIRESLPTIEYLRGCGAKIILIAHIGRSKENTLAPVAEALRKYVPVTFLRDCISDAAVSATHTIKESECLLLENLRGYGGETTNDVGFAMSLAKLGDIFVNEAFSNSHRPHASIIGVPLHLPSYAGIAFAKEVKELTRVLVEPTSPSVFVFGGAKFDKRDLIKKFMKLYDMVFVCGARGVNVGASLVGEMPLTDVEIIHSDKVLLPKDVRVQSLGGETRIDSPNRIHPTDVIMDIGPTSVDAMLDALSNNGTLLWNGPLGFYERGFTDATEAFARGVAEIGCCSIVGGGDTVAAIEQLGLNEKFTHVSTAGGAMLEFLEKGTLPGIEALA